MGFGIGALGAAGRGFVQGVEDAQRMARFQEEMDRAKFEREQRVRTLRDQQQQDELGRELNRVDLSVMKEQPFDDSAFRFDETDTLPGKNVTRTDTGIKRRTSDITRDYANILRKRGTPQQAIAAIGLDEQATKLDQQELAARQQAIQRSIARAGMLYEGGRLKESLKILQDAYGLVPDGQQIVEQDGMVGVADNSGRFLMKPMPLDKDTVGAMLGGAMKYMNPEAWAKYAEVGVKQEDSRTKQGLLGVARERAGTEATRVGGQLAHWERSDQNQQYRNEEQAKYWSGMVKASLAKAAAAGVIAKNSKALDGGRPMGYVGDVPIIGVIGRDGKTQAVTIHGDVVPKSVAITPAPRSMGGGAIAVGPGVVAPGMTGEYGAVPLGRGLPPTGGTFLNPSLRSLANEAFGD